MYKNTWRIHQNAVYLCNWKTRTEKRIAVLSNTIPRNRPFFNTLPAICVENEVYMKTGEDLYCKEYQSPRLPRAVLTLNLQHGRQDLSHPEARKSADPQSEQSVKYEETRRSHLEDTRRKYLEEKITERSTRKHVAVTLIAEFKVHLTQQFRKKTLIVKKSYKD